MAGEVRVRLVHVKYWWPDTLKAELDCDADGMVYFNAESYVPADYKVEARHAITDSIYGLTVRCDNDGTYTFLNQY
ncbi:hypothetical protein ES703_91491 [subsurface metagenome]